MKYQILARDIVATDAAASRIFGIDPKDVKHIMLAEEMGIGTTDLEKLNIKRISL